MSENNRFKDFDAFFAEQNREPVIFRLYGEDNILPPALPAILVLKLIRLNEKYPEMKVVPYQDLADMLLSILGEERFETLCKKGLDVDQMAEILEWIMGQYNLGNKDSGGKKGKKRS